MQFKKTIGRGDLIKLTAKIRSSSNQSLDHVVAAVLLMCRCCLERTDTVYGRIYSEELKFLIFNLKNGQTFKIALL